MTLDQLRTFIASRETHIRQIALTRDAARAIIAEHDAEVSRHVEPSFEINVRRHNSALDAAFTLARFKRMAAEDAA